jgi:hypothetical protein
MLRFLNVKWLIMGLYNLRNENKEFRNRIYGIFGFFFLFNFFLKPIP